jgi:tRNA(Ile)-lysidine synthase
MLEIFSAKINHLIQPGHQVALAVSGGADSMCMIGLFTALKLFDITVLIVDHKLRDESTDEAINVKHYISEKFKVNVKILTWDKDYKVDRNIQSKARDSRYSLLKKCCEEANIGYLCTAHNQNDQAETVLMNIMRGSGIDGLVGIRENSIIGSINLLRPMLQFTRDKIVEYLEDNNIKWVEDPSNDNEKYERVKIRKLIKIINSSNLVNANNFISRLNLLSENALCSHNFIAKYVDKKIKEICKFFPIDVITVDAEKLFIEEKEIILRIFRELIRSCSASKYFVRKINLMQLYELFTKSYRKKESFDITLGGCMIWMDFSSKKQHVLVIVKEKLLQSHKVNNNAIKYQFLRKNEVAKLQTMIVERTYEIIDQYTYNKIF